MRSGAGNEGQLSVMRIGGGRLHFIAKAEVQREPGMDAEVVLEEEARIPAVIDLGHRSVLIHRARQAE